MKKRNFRIWTMTLAILLAMMTGCEMTPEEYLEQTGITLPTVPVGGAAQAATKATVPDTATVPEDTVPEETAPVTVPVTTEPVVTDPTETVPEVTDPVETEPPATDPPETEPIVTEPPHQHSYSKETVAPTCDSRGYTKYTCSCGSSYKDNYISELGHSWSDWTVTQEPTFKDYGKKQRSCSTCGDVDTQKIDKLDAADCSHNYEEKVIQGTCESEGYTEHTCTSCGHSYKDSFIPMVAHDMKETDRKAATTSAEGYIQYTCSGCGKIETTVLEKEVLDLKALEEYGRQYAVEHDGYRVEVGLRDGYYPGVMVEITSMEDGYKAVRGMIDSQTNQLEARGLQIVTVLEDGTIARARFDIEIIHKSGNYYWIWTYYG